MNITDNQFINYATYLPKTLTEKITEFLSNQGLEVSQRWVSLLFTFLCLLLFYIAIKITNKPLKWILLIISVILITGLIIPW